MSVRSSLLAATRRLPFGIGTVVAVLVVVMVVIVGVVLSMSGSPSTTTYSAGVLRGYDNEPKVAWTQSSDTLPGYTSDDGIVIADKWKDRWLLSYRSGLGRAFLLVDRATGAPRWKQPVVAGLGDCGLTATGQPGCAIKLGGVADGFYLIDDAGVPRSRSGLDDTAQVVGVGPNFLRVDQVGYRVGMYGVDGRQLWNRTFAAAAKASVAPNGILIVRTADGAEFVIDPADGANRVNCTQCAITAFPTGITVQHNDFQKERVDLYGVTNGTVSRNPSARVPGLQVLPGPSRLPVLTGVGDNEISQPQGRYEIRDPAQHRALWQITDPELSKSLTRPCGDQVAFALKDRSRIIHRLSGGLLGDLPEPSLDDPDANIDNVACVGSAGNRLIFANRNQVTAFDVPAGTVAWMRPTTGGRTESVDGYLVIHEGTMITVLQPN